MVDVDDRAAQGERSVPRVEADDARGLQVLAHEPDQGAHNGMSWSALLLPVAIAWLVLVSAAFGFLTLPVLAIVLLLVARGFRRTD